MGALYEAPHHSLPGPLTKLHVALETFPCGSANHWCSLASSSHPCVQLATLLGRCEEESLHTGDGWLAARGDRKSWLGCTGDWHAAAGKDP